MQEQEVTQEEEVIHIPTQEETGEERVPGFGETSVLPGGGITEGDAVPEMPPGSGMADVAAGSQGGGLDATDTAQPTTTADTTGDRATGLTGLRGG